MLTEERLNQIVAYVNRSGSCTVQQLMKEFDASESTIRRDLILLSQEKRIHKVRGGAVALDSQYHTKDDSVDLRLGQNREAKIQIARYAAQLLKPEDFIYVDAGTTTEFLLEFFTEKNVTFVTNAVKHAKKLSQAGYQTYLTGGEFKASTEAIVGGEAIDSLSKYNFTKGFFGTNGVSDSEGYSTPDVKEALVKKKAMERCRERYVLADASKFSRISSVSFADFSEAVVITDSINQERYRKYTNVIEATEAGHEKEARIIQIEETL